MASGLIGSEILKIAGDIRAMIAQGNTVCNLTVGDFNPSYFPIPDSFKHDITEALEKNETNYPPSDGMLPLRKAVQEFYERELGLAYPIESFLIAGGARPVIYGAYQAIVGAGDKVIYPVPSWNNNHYCHLSGATKIPIVCKAENAFLPTREELLPHITEARMIAICSPLNPSGTAFTADALAGICDLVLQENARRAGTNEKPLFLLYDQVYWMLTFGTTVHYNPVSLRPEMAQYTIFVDGISKAFAATGVRVGWAVAPPDVIFSMSNILGHVGAWAPRAEQLATAKLLSNANAIKSYHAEMLTHVEERLNALYEGLQSLKSKGYAVDAIVPMGAIYLTARFNFNSKTVNGTLLQTNEDIRKYLLEKAQVAIVPFQAFGSTEETGWFRLSVGAVSMQEIAEMLPRLEACLQSVE